MPANSEHVAPASVLIKGTPLGAADMALVEKIEVRNYRGLPDMATIRMADPEGTRVAAPPFKVGDAVEIKLGGLDAAQPASIFKGEIVAYEPEFTSSAAILSFRAMDRSHRLQRGRKSRTFQKMSASDIVKKVVAGARVVGEGRVDHASSTSSCSRAWSPTSTSSTGSPRARTASSASRTARRSCARTAARAAPRPSPSGART